MHFMLQILEILQGHQQRTVAKILSVMQTQRCIFHSRRDFLNLLMIHMPACLAHLRPWYIYVHFGFLLSAAQRCSFTTLTLTDQQRALVQRCSLPVFRTLTASHRCTPPLPPITGRADESAVRLAQKLAIWCRTARHCQKENPQPVPSPWDSFFGLSPAEESSKRP